jgi:hypothetical protein
MGKFYAKGGPQEATAVGINLVNMTTGVHFFAWMGGSEPDEGSYVSIVLTPTEADALAAELRRVAQFVRDDNA